MKIVSCLISVSVSVYILFCFCFLQNSYCSTFHDIALHNSQTLYRAHNLNPFPFPELPDISNSIIVQAENTEKSDTKNNQLASVEDYENAANQILPLTNRIFFNGGADERITLEENVLAFRRLVIKPRTLVDVSKRKLLTSILGNGIDFPLGVSPTAFLSMASPEREIGTAKAAEAAGSIFILSTYSNTKIEDIAKAAPYGRKWMQVYMFTKRLVTLNLVQRAEAFGFEAIVVTVGSPVLGNRVDLNRIPGYTTPNTTLANFGVEMRGYLGVVGRPVVCADVDSILDPSSTWEDVRWLRSLTSLPVFVKGILSPDDAEKAIEYGMDGIFVSNHGGRQLDSADASIDVLPEIAHRVNGRFPIFIDGGIRTGRDIFKALALGADMAFTGRPFIWGLAVNGERGVTDVFNIFRDEFNATMALAGVRTVAEITEAYVGRRKSG